MNSKERFLTALKKGTPDRLPVTVHVWHHYHLNHYLNGMDELSAFKKFGLDAMIESFDSQTMFLAEQHEAHIRRDALYNTKEWINEAKIISNDPKVIEHIIHTPKGDLTYITSGNEMSTWMLEFPIKNKEDVELLKYKPVPKLNKEEISKIYDSIGDAGVHRGYAWGDQCGCWQNADFLYGTEKLIYAAIDDPDWVHYFLNILLEKKLQYIHDSLPGAKYDLMETGGGGASSTVISPKMFEEFCVPYDRKLHDAFHEVGYPVSYHTCGGMNGILDLIIETNTDASETLSPKAIGGNIEGPELYKAMHGKVALIGGMDQIHILEMGTPKEVKNEVYRLFDVFGQGGGYICNTCDQFFKSPIENLKAYGEAARECLY